MRSQIEVAITIDAEYQGQEGKREMLESFDVFFNGRYAFTGFHHLPAFRWKMAKVSPKIINESHESDL